MNQIIFKYSDWETLTSSLYEDTSLESYAYGFYKRSTSRGTVKLLVIRVFIPKRSDYLARTSSLVSLKPEFTEKAFQICEKENLHLLDIHTHPWSESIQFSSIDDREALNTKIPYQIENVPGVQIAFMVIGKQSDIISARLWDGSDLELEPVDKITIV